MTTPATTIPVRLGFTPPSAAIADPDHPGLLRAGERTAGPYGRGAIEQHPCPATDLCADGAPTLDLLDLGVDTVDLSPLDELQQVLAEVAAAGHITEEQASQIRSALSGATLRCTGGATATVQFIAEEGLLLRSSGPNGLSVTRPESSDMNDHGAATFGEGRGSAAGGDHRRVVGRGGPGRALVAADRDLARPHRRAGRRARRVG